MENLWMEKNGTNEPLHNGQRPSKKKMNLRKLSARTGPQHAVSHHAT
jgi:hypothetical protein